MADVRTWAEQLDELAASPSQVAVDAFCSKLSDFVVASAKACGALEERRARDEGGREGQRASRKRLNKPWFDQECVRERKVFFRVKNRIRILPSRERQEQIRAAGKVYKAVLRRKKQEYFKRFHAKIRILRSNNSKEYWKILNSATRNSKDVKLNLELFRDHFQKLSLSGVPSEAGAGAAEEEGDNMSFNQELTPEEIAGLLNGLKNGKAAGLDFIHNEFIKSFPPEFIEVISKFFNLVLHTGMIPEEWCIGIILPLYKNKGDRLDPDNYRGITLLSCLGKLFTSALNARLRKFLEANSRLGEEQTGFRAAYSTADHVFSLHALVELYQQKGERLYCAFVDYPVA